MSRTVFGPRISYILFSTVVNRSTTYFLVEVQPPLPVSERRLDRSFLFSIIFGRGTGSPKRLVDKSIHLVPKPKTSPLFFPLSTDRPAVDVSLPSTLSLCTSLFPFTFSSVSSLAPLSSLYLSSFVSDFFSFSCFGGILFRLPSPRGPPSYLTPVSP